MIIRSVFFLFLLSSTLHSQYKSEEKLTESDAADYLKLGGYRYNITRNETEEGLIKWSGHNGSNTNKIFMSYYFWPLNTGISMAVKTKVLTKKPNFNSWRSSLPYNFIITDQSLNYIYASDNRNPESVKKSKSIERANEPYYADNYFWYESSTNHYKPTSVDKIGFHYDDKFYSFLSNDTFNLAGIVDTFFLDYAVYLKKLMEKYYKKGEHSLVEAVSNSLIDNKQNKTILFKQLEGNATLALAVGMNDNSQIKIYVDPDKWTSISDAKRFYIIYHELGHDIFNFNHGNGGKMMFNYIEKDVTWNDFLEERIEMFDNYIAKNYSVKNESNTNKPQKDSNLIIASELIKQIPQLYKSKEYQKITNASKFIYSVFININAKVFPDEYYNALYLIGVSKIKLGNIQEGCNDLNNLIVLLDSNDKKLEMKVNYYIKSNCN